MNKLKEPILIGIYKITSPSKRIYIGQSTDIKERFKQYYKLRSCKSQTRLYSSYLKYGVINHKFEIIEECKFEELNIRERYWQDYYNVISEKGLNCRLTETDDKTGIFSDYTKNLMKISPSKRVIDIINKTYFESAKECARINNIKYHTLVNKLTGKIINDTNFLYETTIPMKGINYNCELITSKDKKIINIKTGKIYNSLIECCLINNINYFTTKRKLNGGRKNNTPFKYLSKNEYLLIKYKKLLIDATMINNNSPFNIYDSEYIELLNKHIMNLSNKIYDDNIDYDAEPVQCCSHCKSLYLITDDDDNDECVICRNSLNETETHPTIFHYLNKYPYKNE